MTIHPDDPKQSGVSPLGPLVPQRQSAERSPPPTDRTPAPPFSRSSRREATPETGAGKDDSPSEMPTEDLLDEPFGEILMADDLDFSGENSQVDELPWLADLPGTPEASGAAAEIEGASPAPGAESEAPEWLDWLDGMDEGGAVEPETAPEVTPEPEAIRADPPVAPPEASSDDPLLEIAERLEKIAASLRTGSAGTLFSEQSTDPLAALVAGYALGYARRRGEGSDR